MKTQKKMEFSEEKLLTADELSQLKGGDSFCCYCGFVGGPYEGSKFPVNASSIEDALQGAGAACHPYGATCSGGGC